MAVLSRANVAAPTLPKETVEVEALGGEVVVQGLTLTQRLAVGQKLANVRAAHLGGDSAADINVVYPMLLALAVHDAEGLPLWTEAQWEVFGGKHQGQALALFNVAWRLAGFEQADTTKN